MAAVLVFFVPLYAVMAVAVAMTREVPLDAIDYVTGIVSLLAGSVAYGLSRTSAYRRGMVFLSLVTIVAASLIGAREPGVVRAICSLLFGLTGVLYASLMLSRRATIFAGGGYLALMLAGMLYHPAIGTSDMILPGFFAIFMVSMIVVGAHLRRLHVEDLVVSTTAVVTSEARLRATLDSGLDAVVVIDQAALVVEWGSVAASTFGIATDAALGRSLKVLVGAPEATCTLDGLKHPRVARCEFVAKNHSGRSFPCELVVAPLRTGDGAAVFFRDVSQQRKLETRLLLTDRLETMGRMVAGVAHEVNNPLAFVMSNLAHLERELARPVDALDPSELKGVVTEALDGARRIQGIVRNLRSFSRSGDQEAMQSVDVERSLDASIHMVQAQLREARASLTREYSGAGMVMAYEGRLGQVFLNLLINAIQALPGEADRREITVCTERLETEVRVAIRDSGKGIDSVTRSRLFEPFFTTKAPGQGTGLGLSISQNIIATLGGEILVESAPSSGTTFTVVLPTVPAPSTVERW